MDLLVAQLVVVVHGQRRRLRRLLSDGGVSTLEMVIIALGLMAVAGLLVAAVTAAVTSRTDQLR
jgi:hypothetical protein